MASFPSRPAPGLLDLEKELSCSICTETLYQPLTLLDCLHTFCGSCLKLWFGWQASQATSAHPHSTSSSSPRNRPNPYTCPQCRASVRGTRADAKINTLLDMYLHANPGMSKSEAEKEEMRGKYTPGDDVVPSLSGAGANGSGTGSVDLEDERDRRMVEEVREMSLRELGAAPAGNSSRGYERGARHRARSRDGRSGNHHHHRGRDSEQSRSQARQLEHQSSLRSLISADDVDSAEMEEEIMRQIFEEGLLDGVDLQNMTGRQEDELSERIAEAYRRRHWQRARERQEERRTEAARETRETRPRDEDTNVSANVGGARRTTASRDDRRSPAGRGHARSASGVALQQVETTQHASVSRTDLLEAYPTGQGQGYERRRSSEGRRQTAPFPLSVGGQPAAARSATDLSNRPRTSERHRRMSQETGNADPRAPPSGSSIPRPPPGRMGSGSNNPLTPPATQQAFRMLRDPPNHPATTSSLSPRRMTPLAASDLGPSGRLDASRTLEAPRAGSQPPPRPTERPRQETYPEPKISCERCGKSQIQYDVHYNCSVCHAGKYNLCTRCYQLGRGCLNWYGFGRAAMARYDAKARADAELPHALMGCRYRRAPPSDVVQAASADHAATTRRPAAERLDRGAFCSVCRAHADPVFWKCDACNEGEWGYCSSCVARGRHCTHPLQPVAWTSSAAPQLAGATTAFSTATAEAPRQAFPPGHGAAANTRPYHALAISTTCGGCAQPIPPSQRRFHCAGCALDTCGACYARLAEQGAVSAADGERGWRRCARGHRMVVYCFADGAAGARRTVVRDLVGGHFLKDEDGGQAAEGGGQQAWQWADGPQSRSRKTSRAAGELAPDTRFPPDGGVGRRCIARWAWVPDEGVADELMFPRGAEITEAMDVNDEWWDGCYAGAKGVFPANHVALLSVVTMS